ncbi:hypothetical protein D5400_11645 [Georhizobium profundi]|uniref:Uncharacterized protein n=1 Tax=Georhizobium profundi TaxID=2341112 RepID=A0A3Q8XPB1_9HYPH|nr:hypothetical protein [Georhizobium profundi]AZN71842.1 hypothetical protein D5400_11645 [Georhizobium profundi]
MTSAVDEHQVNKIYDTMSEYCACRDPREVLAALGELVADTYVACSGSHASAIEGATDLHRQILIRIDAAEQAVGIPFRGGERQ